MWYFTVSVLTLGPLNGHDPYTKFNRVDRSWPEKTVVTGFYKVIFLF